MKAIEARHIGKLFMEIDTDSNGKIELEEFKKSPLVQRTIDLVEA